MQPPLSQELRALLGSPARARRLGSSPRSRVWLVELDQPVVVKQIVGGSDADERFAREVTALRLAARVEPPVVPRLLGTDPVERVLVLERVSGHRPSERWAVDYASALARLHAATGPPDTGALPAWSGPSRQDSASFLELAARLGVTIPPGAAQELDALVDRLGQAGGHALLHGDPCPGNDLHTPDGVRFIDFEQASLGSGLMELAYLRVGFPTCWCVTAIPEPLLLEAEDAYRAGSGAGPDLTGDLTDACAGWLIRGDALVERAHRESTDHLARLPREDWVWGTVTARQRLAHRLGVVARMTCSQDEGRDELGALGRLCADLRDRMLMRWPTLLPPPARRPSDA